MEILDSLEWKFYVVWKGKIEYSRKEFFDSLEWKF